MTIDKNKVRTQDDLDEQAPTDQGRRSSSEDEED